MDAAADFLLQPALPLDDPRLPEWLCVVDGEAELYAQPHRDGIASGPRRWLGRLPGGTVLPSQPLHPAWRLWLIRTAARAVMPVPVERPELWPAHGNWFHQSVQPYLQLFGSAEAGVPAHCGESEAAYRQVLHEFLHDRLSNFRDDADGQLPDEAPINREALDSAFERFVGVLHEAAARTIPPQGSLAALGTEIARCMGLETVADAARDLPGESVEAWARRAGLRARKVALRDQWERQSGPPLLAFLEAGHVPVALMPQREGGYTVLRGGDAGASPPDAVRLEPFAWTLHGRLPARPIRLIDLLRFGWRGAVDDAALMFWTALLAGALGALTPVAVAYVFQTVIPSGELRLLTLFGGAIALLALGAGVLKLSSDLAALRIEGRLGNGLQSAFFDRLLRLPLDFFASMPSGDIASRMATIDAVRRSLASVSVHCVTAAFYTAGAFGTMLYFMPRAAAITGATMLLVWLLAVLIGRRQNALLLEGEKIEGNVVALAVQLIQGVTKLRLAGAEDRAYAFWGRGFAEMRRRLAKARFVQAGFTILLALAEVALTATAFAVFGYTDVTPDTPSVSEFLALVGALATFSASGLSLGQAIVQAIALRPFFQRLHPLMQAVPETADGPSAQPAITGRIEVAKLSFRYGRNGPWVLRDVSFAIQPGQFVAVVGASGSGKSTLLKLLLGLERPVQGGVFYDGNDLSGLDTEALRRQLGVVLQTARPMPGSLFENIAGIHACTPDQAWEAARRAGLEEEIRAMPMGLHTILSEGNATLSGGQVQRLLLARALAGKPKVLFLDEATSALDNLTQSHVSRCLKEMAVTRIAIAHRLSTVQDADLILVLDEGRVIEQGSFQELMARGGFFARLARRQLI